MVGRARVSMCADGCFCLFSFSFSLKNGTFLQKQENGIPGRKIIEVAVSRLENIKIRPGLLVLATCSFAHLV